MFSLIPRNKGFYDLFEKSVGIVVQTAELFAAAMHEYARRDEYVARIRQLEHEGDEVAHRTLDKLDQTFITPFDREDIQALMLRMDDVVDAIDAASKRLILYRIDEPTTWMIKLTGVLHQACERVRDAVGALRTLKKNKVLQEHLVEIHRLENIGDEDHHAAVAELYDMVTDAILVMKWKEIYDRTEHAIDLCEDIANTIEAIALKNA